MSSSNKPKVHVMLDIETLDVKPSSVILSIGACTVDLNQTFYAEPAIDSQPVRSRSTSTIEWWSKQSVPMPLGDLHLKDALFNLTLWIRQLREEPIIWCKGTDFDTAILAHAYNMEGMELPWKYNSIRDMRTLKKCHPQLQFGQILNPNPHNALQDALHQSRELNLIFQSNPYLQWE